MKLKSQRLHLIKECRGNAWWENFSNNRRGSDALLKRNSNTGVFLWNLRIFSEHLFFRPFLVFRQTTNELKELADQFLEKHGFP